MANVVIVMIPAFNEAELIAQAIGEAARARRTLPSLRILVVDDGSTDGTPAIAWNAGADDVLELGSHRGLGVAHRAGLRHAIDSGASVIVNFDADLQYCGEEIPALVKAITRVEADVVIGDRQLATIRGYPIIKRWRQALWSRLIARTFRIEVRDATSGFRAYRREAACFLSERLSDPYTYTQESLYVLAASALRLAWQPITIRHPTERPSRLVRDKIEYARRFIGLFLRYARSRATAVRVSRARA